MHCRYDAHVDLGVAEARRLAGDQHVAGNGQGYARGPRRPGQCRDRRLAHPVLEVVHLEIELFQEAPQVEPVATANHRRSEEHTSELQSLMRTSYAVFCLKKKKQKT